jgi:predicted PurR-regulated permease PerM
MAPDSRRMSRASFPTTLTLTDSELPRIVSAPTAPETRRGRRTALAVLLLLSFLVVAWIASPLWIGIALGAVMAFTTQIPFRKLSERLGDRRKLAAALVTIGSGLLCAGVAAVVFYVASSELLTFIEYARGKLNTPSPSEGLGAGVLGLLHRLGVDPSAVDTRIHRELEDATGYATMAAGKTLAATTGAVLGLMVALATMYYVLIDWTRLALRLESVLPLDPRHTRALILEFRNVGRGTLVGTIGTALVQGALASVGYALGGAPQVATFGLLTAIASLLPVVGTGTIWAPVGVAQILRGHVLGGAFILVWGFCVVMTMTDYVIRPRLIGRSCHAHPLFILIALLGGVEAIGLPGLIVAPILVSLFVAVLSIYEREIASVGGAHPERQKPPEMPDETAQRDRLRVTERQRV